MNKVILIGRLTKEPNFKQGNGDNSKSVTRFTLAVTREFKRDEADFVNCVIFNKGAETIGQYMKKGSQIAIVGSIRTGSYEKDGITRYTTDIVVDSFEFIGGGNHQDNDLGDEPF